MKTTRLTPLQGQDVSLTEEEEHEETKPMLYKLNGTRVIHRGDGGNDDFSDMARVEEEEEVVVEYKLEKVKVNGTRDIHCEEGDGDVAVVVVEEYKLENVNGTRGVSQEGDNDVAMVEVKKGVVEYKLEKVFPVYAMGRKSSLDESLVMSFEGLEIGGGNGGVVKDVIWEEVRAEAKLEAEKEPILSSFLYASILSHACLERSLGFVLANRLQNSTLFATQLMDIFDDILMHDKGIQRSIRLDMKAFKDRDPSCLSYCWALLYLKGFHSLQSYRVANALWNKGRRVLALALQSRISEVFGVDIHPAAKIGEGILLDHGTGVVIGETAVIGNRVSLMQGVTLGGSGKEVGDRHPKIRQGALIGAGATILGNIVIGEGAMIAACSLVLKDIPPHSAVVGIPAKVVGYIKEQDPSLTMKHDATKDFFPSNHC